MDTTVMQQEQTVKNTITQRLCPQLIYYYYSSVSNERHTHTHTNTHTHSG
ncbi:hypothetical protein EXN66_Car014265 [Channa argus]|uniref:Uncharacterized protein n=1 Tax=Channa argus TaxID=215402 RepID=A0A6G1Q8H5_CHAAH|nr:hypothetical protein EXN66_Car014265 [Channa argus]